MSSTDLLRGHRNNRYLRTLLQADIKMPGRQAAPILKRDYTFAIHVTTPLHIITKKSYLFDRLGSSTCTVSWGAVTGDDDKRALLVVSLDHSRQKLGYSSTTGGNNCNRSPGVTNATQRKKGGTSLLKMAPNLDSLTTNDR
jgi:hypothetical protein